MSRKLTLHWNPSRILGPLLFILYINGLPSDGVFSKKRMYADDINVTSAVEDPDTLQVKILI